MLIILIIVGIFISKIYTEKKYQENLSDLTFYILSSSADAESAGNLYMKVWYNTIYEKSDSTTNKYTKDGYIFNDDFNTSLRRLENDADYKENIMNIENDRDIIVGLMKDLANPPGKYKEAYEKLNEYYNAYMELSSLATSPSGSYNSYSENFRNAEDKAFNLYNAMKLYIG